METLHKLAGVQDASDLQVSSNERPSQPQVIPESPSVLDKDTETPHLSHRGSRASLPLNRQPSHKSFRSSKNQLSRSQSRSKRDSDGVALDANYPPPPAISQEQIDAAYQRKAGLPTHAQQQPRTSHDTTASTSTGATEDFPWGPNHPCYPHPNPHCLPSSPEYQTTRVIRVRRDWLVSGDLYPQYANLYPEILDPMVTEEDFRFLISNLNARLKAAFDPFSTRAWVDALMGVVTGFLWDDVGMTGAKREERGLERFLEEWNRGKEVRVCQVRRTGFMGLDFVIPDPGIDGLAEDEEEEGEGGVGPAE